MREDMFKVIVERPRRGGLTDSSARRHRNDEYQAGKIGMKQGHISRKGLNENLAPLRRWLAKQAGRPWDKVYSELAGNIDRRNTVQEHIFAHIDQFVERETYMVGKQVYFRGRWRNGNEPISESNAELYVHPLTGMLLENRKRRTWRQRRDAEWSVKQMARDAVMRELTPMRQLRKLNGCWFEVELSPLPEGVPYQDGPCTCIRYPAVWDAVLKRKVSRAHGHQPSEMQPAADYGKQWVYASAKRQLSAAELKQRKLVNGIAEDPPPEVTRQAVVTLTKAPGCPGVLLFWTTVASCKWLPPRAQLQTLKIPFPQQAERVGCL